ncbi:MAG: UTP--glucose-1-phosphate uridylyltransferase GalU [Candidatus Tyloplasma litorale]|nr:MAG: UTP--glucose-1-phosphate uridylyltransferase GalU [Mycoplasmatales bacterium]
MKKIKKAIIPVAGNGTRFLPFTKTIPKEMLPILNKPTIDYIVDEAIAAGIEEIIFVTSSSKSSIVDYYDRNFELEYILKKKGKDNLIKEIISPTKKVKCFWVRQHKQKGLGHAVLLTQPLIDKDETFALLLGDDVIHHDSKTEKSALSELIEVYEKTGLSVIGVQEVPQNQISNYGIVEIGKKLDDNYWKISRVVEKPKQDEAPSNLGIVGRYLLNYSIFDYLSEQNIDEKTNEIQITDSILKLSNSKGVIARRLSGIRYDMGSTIGFMKAQIEYSLRREEYREDVLKIMKEQIKKYSE